MRLKLLPAEEFDTELETDVEEKPIIAEKSQSSLNKTKDIYKSKSSWWDDGKEEESEEESDDDFNANFEVDEDEDKLGCYIFT